MNRRKFIPPVQKGFTLVELLVVIAVVGTLAVGVMTVINPVDQVQKSRDASRKSDLSAIQKALELYYQDNGYFPDSLDGRIADEDGQPIDWGTNGFAPYIERLPKDSNNAKAYIYDSNGESYWLFASLDRGSKDPQACNEDDTPCGHAAAANLQCGPGNICNFGLSSPNVSVD